MNKVIEGTIITAAIIGAFFVGYLIPYERSDLAFLESEEEMGDWRNCSSESLYNVSRCLVDYVSGFYNYTERADTPKTLKDIQQNGGDCYDYAGLYIRFAEELGFQGEHFSIAGENDVFWHRVAILWDKSDSGDYCLIDQRRLWCSKVY